MRDFIACLALGYILIGLILLLIRLINVAFGG